MSGIKVTHTLSIDQCAQAALALAVNRTILFQGDMGSGKTSILKLLAEKLPTHTPVFFDSTTKDLGDMMVPMFDKIEDEGVVRYAINEELGFHHKKPVILMIDEFGKANPAVKNGLLRVMLERKIATNELPKGSLVIATTNLGAEGVGDLLPPHARNRITIINMRKSTNEEWLEWGVNNDIHTSVLQWAKETPQLFQSFTQVKDPQDNPYIYHPNDPTRTSFVTPRSLEAVSDWVKQQNSMDDDTLLAALVGTIGARGAADFKAYLSMMNELPRLEDLKNDVDNAIVPTKAAAIMMVVYRTLATIEYKWVDNWMKYMSKLPREAQGVFVNGVNAESYTKRDVVTNCEGFGEWCIENGWLVDNKWRKE
jgi:energy-coupling factor transporter ATP-binding protein EcfA2